MIELTIEPILKKHEWEIAHWKYDGIYEFYNRIGNIQYPDNLEEKIENSYVVYDDKGELIGHFHFGSEGQIPTIENYCYTDDYLDMGLGLRPDICGHGFGVDFIQYGIEFARKHYNRNKFRLSVAAFNERAVKAYEKAGFIKECEVTNSYFKNKFYIMIKE